MYRIGAIIASLIAGVIGGASYLLFRFAGFYIHEFAFHSRTFFSALMHATGIRERELLLVAAVIAALTYLVGVLLAGGETKRQEQPIRALVLTVTTLWVAIGVSVVGCLFVVLGVRE